VSAARPTLSFGEKPPSSSSRKFDCLPFSAILAKPRFRANGKQYRNDAMTAASKSSFIVEPMTGLGVRAVANEGHLS
jgi:hypothetical protein